MLQWIYENGWATPVYYAFHVMGFLAVFLFNVWYGKKRGITPKDAIITTLIVYPVTYLLIYVLYWIENGFSNFGGNNIVRGFVYIPLVAWPVAKWLKHSWGKVCDFIAPCVCLCQGVSHIGCIFSGCCSGYAAGWGIYQARYDGLAVPVQLFEAATALVIFGLLVYMAAKQGYKSDGKAYPMMLVLFGSTRFLWEFARNNEKIFLGCSSLAFHALFMAVVGAAALYHLKEKKKGKGGKRK